MPQLEQYQSKLDLPRTLPGGPTSPGIASWSQAIAGAEAANNQFASAASIFARQEAQQEALEQTTQATAALLQVQAKMEKFEGGLRDQLATGQADDAGNPIPADPREFKRRHMAYAQTVMNDAIEEGAQYGPAYQKFLATHASTYLKTSVGTFSNEMDKLWHNKHSFDVQTNMDNLVKAGIRDTTNDGKQQLSGIYSLAQAQVAGGFWTAQEGHNAYKAYERKLMYGKAESLVMADPGRWWDQRTTQAVPEMVSAYVSDPEDLKAMDEAANRAFGAQEAARLRAKNENDRIIDDLDEKSAKEVSNLIDQEQLNHPMDLEPWEPKMKKDTYEEYKKLLRVVERGENIVSDLNILNNLETRLYSIDEVAARGVSGHEIIDYADKRRLNHKDASRLLKDRAEIVKAWENTGLTQYDKEAQEGESLLNTLLGPLDWMKDQAQARALRGQAIHQFRSMWWKNRQESIKGRAVERAFGKPGYGEPLFPTHPIDWVFDIYAANVLPRVQDLALNAAQLQQSLPEAIQTPDKAFTEYQAGRITYGEWRKVVTIDKLNQAITRETERTKGLEQYKRGKK